MHLGKYGDSMSMSYFKNKKVLITGHNGFKGSWMCKILQNVDAEIYGYSLDPPTIPSLYHIAGLNKTVNAEYGDISDFDKLYKYVCKVEPDVIIHMAAQPLVRESYAHPLETYRANVMGTVNIMECLRLTDFTESFLNVTTDKVYENIESNKYYREFDPLNGYDPYSNSKSCSELVTQSYKRSFFKEKKCAISTARAGNVIGGGDFAKDRIIPDCVNAAINKETIKLRNPNSIRPYQHVLEPLAAYLSIVSSQVKDPNKSGSYNVGPTKEDCITTGELATLFCKSWGEGLKWESTIDDGPHEANYLKLDSTLIKEKLGFLPRWHIEEAVQRTVDWFKMWKKCGDVSKIMDMQIEEYFGDRL